MAADPGRDESAASKRSRKKHALAKQMLAEGTSGVYWVVTKGPACMLTSLTFARGAAPCRILTLTAYRLVQYHLKTDLPRASVSTVKAVGRPGMAKDIVEALQPQPLWNLFKKLSEIPRPSKHEEQ